MGRIKSARTRDFRGLARDFGARLHPPTENPALLVGDPADVRERHRALRDHARFDPPGVLFHLQGGVEHDSSRGNRKSAVGRSLGVTFEAAPLHDRARVGVANGRLAARDVE